MLSPFMERFGGQSPKVLANTKGARVVFYGTSRRLLTKGIFLHAPGNCPPHSLLVIRTLFDGRAKQLSSRCVRLMGWWVNQRPESKFRPLLACRGLLPTMVPAPSTASSNGRDPNVVAPNNDAFGQAVPVLTAASIRLQGLPRPI
jgi:hypothetical protein